MQYDSTFCQDIWPAKPQATVTAGFKCAPEIGPNMYTSTTSVDPTAVGPHKGFATMLQTPMVKTNRYEPTNSATYGDADSTKFFSGSDSATCGAGVEPYME